MEKERKIVWEFFISHYRFTYVIVAAIIFLGLFALIQIPKESNPEIDVPFAIVTTVFPGAAAVDTEELVTDVLEDRILSLSDIEEVSSTSREGISSIFVEFSASADSDRKVDELKDKVDEAKTDLPSEAEDPVVTKVRFSDQPILTFALSGPFSIAQLKQFAEDLKDEIERISGVSKVEISGGQEREVQVIVHKDRLDTFGLGLAQVTSAIATANADVPIGSIETAGANYTLRLEGMLQDAADVSNVPVGIVGGSVVFVKDVADVVDGYQEKTSISRLSVGGSTPLPSISLNVFKTSGGNIMNLADSAIGVIEEAQQEVLPENIQIEIVQNLADFIRDDLQTLSRSGLQTVLLLMILLFVFLGWREALLAAIALPLTFLLTFIFLAAIGSTLNFLSLFALILSLGILIDSSIVMVEGMHEQINKQKKSPKEAAIATLRNFYSPLFAGTLTTMFAFAPMLLMSGILGEFIKHIPITIIIVLSSSLFVAFGVIPVLGMKWLQLTKERPAGETEKERKSMKRFLKKVQIADRLGTHYEHLLLQLLRSKKVKRQFVAVIALLFIGSMALPFGGVLPINMFPSQEFATFFIDISKPIGTPLEETSRAMEKIERVLQEDARVESFVVQIGSAARLDIGSVSSGGNLGNIIVNLVPEEERDQKSYDITDDYQRKLTKLVDEADVSVTDLSGGPPTGAPVLVTLKGDSLVVLEQLAREVEKSLQEIPGATNIQTSIPESAGEFTLEIDRGKAQLYGVNTLEVARILRNAISGTTATVIRKDGEEMDVVVKLALNPVSVEDGKTNIVDLSIVESLSITTPAGDVPLAAFTKSKLTGGRPVIQHIDGERVIQVTSQIEGGITAQKIFSELQEKMEDVIVPSGYEVHMGGEAEDLEQSYNDMFRAMIWAVFLIGGVLVLQFRSFRQPWFILSVVPLSLIGVFPGLVLTGQPLSFPGIIGIVALTGIVVNDAIILLDRANINRRRGLEITEAIKEAGKSRLQPILLTTITTAVGIIPITLSSELWASLGVSIIFGLLAATVITLFVVPMLYVQFAEKQLEVL